MKYYHAKMRNLAEIYCISQGWRLQHFKHATKWRWHITTNNRYGERSKYYDKTLSGIVSWLDRHDKRWMDKAEYDLKVVKVRRYKGVTYINC